jgi:hypothetical protein
MTRTQDWRSPAAEHQRTMRKLDTLAYEPRTSKALSAMATVSALLVLFVLLPVCLLVWKGWL